MATVNIKEVSKDYGNGVRAVNTVSLDIEKGEFIVLVGPSGCGKSTLLRMVAGLETITDGEVRIGDRVVNNVDPADRDIAMVFQNYALYPHMTVRNNMAYGLKNRGMNNAEIDRRVDEAAAILRLEEYLARRPRQLSGGQRQRVAMGRAIVREPAAFLFDEPLSNLDAKLRVEMRGEIKQLQKRLGTTSIYVTHDQLEAMTMADRIVVLNQGRIEQIGSPLEVYRTPQSAFVASFIGSPAMNLLDARAEAGRVVIGDQSVEMNGHAVDDGPVTLGLRAEDMQLASRQWRHGYRAFDRLCRGTRRGPARSWPRWRPQARRVAAVRRAAGGKAADRGGQIPHASLPCGTGTPSVSNPFRGGPRGLPRHDIDQCAAGPGLRVSPPKPGRKSMFKTIIAAVDGSDHATEALKIACDLAEKYSSKLHIVHTPQAVSDTLIVGYAAVPVPPTREEMQKAGREVTGAAESLVQQAGLSEFDSAIIMGDPAHAIVDAAESRDADLIVMGRRGLGSLSGLLVGSTTTKVSQLAPCAVLTVK